MMVTARSLRDPGLMAISPRPFLPSTRLALVTAPPDTLKEWSPNVL